MRACRIYRKFYLAHPCLYDVYFYTLEDKATCNAEMAQLYVPTYSFDQTPLPFFSIDQGSHHNNKNFITAKKQFPFWWLLLLSLWLFIVWIAPVAVRLTSGKAGLDNIFCTLPKLKCLYPLSSYGIAWIAIKQCLWMSVTKKV